MPRASHLVVAGLLVITGLGLHRSRGLAWGGAQSPDGTRFKVSPVGLSHVLRPDQTVSPTEDCRWSSAPGVHSPCAVAAGGAGAFRGLRLVPVLLASATGLALAAGIGLLAFGRTGRRLSAVLPGAAAVVAVSAPALFAFSAPRALRALVGLDFGVGGTLGTLQVALATAVLVGLTIALARPRGEGGAIRWLASGVLLLLSSSAFVLMFPLLGGLAFLTAGLGLGFAAGHWSRRDAVAESPAVAH